MLHIERVWKPAAALIAAVGVAVTLGGAAATPAPVVHKVGAVTRHAAKYAGQDIVLTGYLLAREPGYVLFSDEPGGRIGRYDLPVSGDGIDQLQPRTKYVIEGTFLDHGLTASNGNAYHLALTAPPQPATP